MLGTVVVSISTFSLRDQGFYFFTKNMHLGEEVINMRDKSWTMENIANKAIQKKITWNFKIW